LAREHDYWVGSPEDNKAIGLSSGWHDSDKSAHKLSRNQ
jgi:hypothetical protein